MFNKMKDLMEMKKQADQIKRDLDATLVEVEEVRGIKISITGSQTYKSITIDEQHLGADNRSRLERDLLRSVNAAMKKAQQEAAKKMSALMPGM